MPVISTNTSANSALLNLNKNASMQEKFLNQLSSGSRINSSADDAAGLAVAGQLQADITTLTQSARNAQQAEALLQTADGALARQGDILQRMKSLATQFNSGTVDTNSRTFINSEYTALVDQLNLITSSTEFNGSNLIDGSYNQNFVVGIQAADAIAVDLSTIDATSSGLNLNGALSVSGGGVFNTDLAVGLIAASEDTLLTALDVGIVGAAATNTLSFGLDIDDDGTYNDAGEAIATLTITAATTVADLVSTINAANDSDGNQVFNATFSNGSLTVSLIDPSALDTLGTGNSVGVVDITTVGAAGVTVAGTDAVGVALAVGAATSAETVQVGNSLAAFNDDLSIIDTAIQSISSARSEIGAFTSAFQFQNDNINTQIKNLSAAKSTIVDVDIAEAQTNFTNAQVLTEAATAALAQANQITTSLLSLLR
jgi:flagellin